METNTFCRLCALKSDNYLDVFKEEGVKLNLAQKIKQCLQIWLIPEDNLPKTICIDCCGKVDEYSVFFNLCSQSQVSLIEIFGTDANRITNEVETSEIKPSAGTTEVLLDETFEDDGDHDVSEYNVECVLSENCSSNGAAKRKFGIPVKPPSPGGTEAIVKQVENNEDVQGRRVRPRSKLAAFKEESTDAEEDDDSFNLKNSLDDYTNSNCPTLSKFEGYNWKCTDCDQDLPSLSALKTHHQDVHNQPPTFKCNECKKVYTRYRSFARHVKLHGNPKKFSCDICGKCFSQKTVLQSHSTVHSEERPHVCTQCGKAFKQFSSLYLHSRCHLPDQVKPKFPCKMCPKEFSTKHTLETHIKIHTGERNFICDICGKSFIAKGSLDYHMLTHNDAKPHSCPVCGKGFKTARLLTKHSTLHTGIKPHQCDVCGKQFRERGALKEHNRIHTGAMPYSCEFCGKLFRFKGILTVHRRQHTGERPYSCAECNREFTNWANYNKHMKRRHRNNEQLNQRVVVHRQPPTVLVQSEPIVQNIGVQPMQPTTGYTDQTDHNVYKLAEEHDVYRLSSYSGAIQMGAMNYYIPQIHTGVLQRNQ